MVKIVFQHLMYPKNVFQIYLPNNIDTEDINHKNLNSQMISGFADSVGNWFLSDGSTEIGFDAINMPEEIDSHRTSDVIKGGRRLVLMAEEALVKRAYENLIQNLKKYDLI